jgi:hypothetical protein
LILNRILGSASSVQPQPADEQRQAASNVNHRIPTPAAQNRQLRAELGPAAIPKKLGIARSSVYRAFGRGVA